MILTGDIGGTKVNLALFDIKQEIPCLSVERSYVSRDYPDLITHLPWEIDVRELQRLLGTDSVSMINDLAALACAVPYLTSEELEVIQIGHGDPNGPIGVLAAGTGLGQAFLIPAGEGRYGVLETEGGQCDFPARNPLENLLRESLGQVSGRVCIEDVLSGPGLIRIFEFMKEQDQATEPNWLAEEFEQKDPASVISRNGLSKKFKPCEQALEMFVSIYGAVAGNLALQMMTRGGVFIGGGVAPEILSLLKSDLFLEAFRDKGKFREFMEQVPVKVVMNKRAPLLGAAYFALGESKIQ